jgi:hypothetical protein
MPGPDPDPDLATPSEVKIRVRGFLQCPQTISITSLRKCLPDVTDLFLANGIVVLVVLLLKNLVQMYLVQT